MVIATKEAGMITTVDSGTHGTHTLKLLRMRKTQNSWGIEMNKFDKLAKRRSRIRLNEQPEIQPDRL